MKRCSRCSKVNSAPPADFNLQFEALVQLHTPYLKGVAFSVLRNREDVEDVLQESFMKAYVSLLGFSEEDRATLQARSWLRTIVRNTAYTYRSRKKKWISLDALNDNDLDNIVRRHDWTDAVVTRIEIDAEISEALAILPARQRILLVLSIWQDMSYEEIAEILSMTEASVRAKARRARQQLGRIFRQRDIRRDDLRAWYRDYRIPLGRAERPWL